MKFSVGLVLLWITSNTLGANFRGLGDLAGGTFLSIATGVSLDGQVVVGYSASSNGTEAVRWSAGTGLLGLSELAGGIFFSAAYGVSPEGTVIVGEGRSASGREAFRWTEAGGMVGLGDLPGGVFNSAAFAVSSNGSFLFSAPTLENPPWQKLESENLLRSCPVSSMPGKPSMFD